MRQTRPSCKHLIHFDKEDHLVGVHRPSKVTQGDRRETRDALVSRGSIGYPGQIVGVRMRYCE